MEMKIQRSGGFSVARQNGVWAAACATLLVEEVKEQLGKEKI